MQAYKEVAEQTSDSFSGIRKKATKYKQRALLVSSFTYARMTRRWRTAPNIIPPLEEVRFQLSRNRWAERLVWPERSYSDDSVPAGYDFLDAPKLPSQGWNVVLLQQNYASNLDVRRFDASLAPLLK